MPTISTSITTSTKLTIFLSFSFTAASLTFPPFLPNPNPNSKSYRRLSLSPLSTTTAGVVVTATAGDLLSLLGIEDQASKIDSDEAQQLWSCLKFLVPFRRNSVNRRSMSSQRRDNVSRDRENELVWWPPAPVLELSRLAVHSGGDPDAIYPTLNPTVVNVPDVEGSNKSKCQLTRTTYGTRFINEDLNAYFAFLFKLIASRGPSVGLNVSLSRYDFFHGHFFLAKDTGRLGILFHAKEFPAYDKEVFPFNMGYCQKGSDVAYDDSMNLRNILWLAPLPSTLSDTWVAPGVLVVLDAHPGGIIYRDIVPDYVQIARTIYEDDFGVVPMDVNYLDLGVMSPSPSSGATDVLMIEQQIFKLEEQPEMYWTQKAHHSYFK